MEDKKKPELVLARPDSFEDLMTLVTKVSGQPPTPEDRAKAKAKFDQWQARRQARLRQK
jgi:steroid 5-alpha reductase family enzyme